MTARLGILLVNLGTPDRPDAEAVGRYLKQFLGDPAVIDLPWPLRYFLVHCIIVPKRAAASAKNYQKVWFPEGSPLLVYGQRLQAELKKLDDRPIALAMRYGNPSIQVGVEELLAQGVERILVLPLFPQFAPATTGSVHSEARRVLKRLGRPVDLEFIEDFADHPAFIATQAEVLRRHCDLAAADVVLMSFHGLPERQIMKADQSGRCLKEPDCCAQATAANRRCYRARCFATARALAAALALEASEYQVVFQSRLGRAKWIEPYTEEQVDLLLESGKRNFVVVSPAFVADCIETIEELGMALREKIEAAGGTLQLSPAVNAEPRWAQGLVDLINSAVTT